MSRICSISGPAMFSSLHCNHSSRGLHIVIFNEVHVSYEEATVGTCVGSVHHNP